MSAAIWLYSAAIRAAFPLLRGRLRRRFVDKGGPPARWPERLGHEASTRPDGKVIWVHAVSVGEMMSALPLVDALLEARADAHVLLTTTTASSADLAGQRLPARAWHRFAPLDHPGAVARFLSHWRPERAIFLESEVWPAQIAALDRRGIPLALVSARITEKTAARWARMGRIGRAVFGRIPLVLAQEGDSAARARSLGAPVVEVAGSLKSAGAALPVDPDARAEMRDAIGRRPAWVAASTHPGEEEVVAEAHGRVREKRPDALCLLVPRHAERGAALAGTLGASVVLRSTGGMPGDGTAIYLADSYGEMGLWFSLSDVVFLGGSLVPGIGGHNPLEPAALGCAILTGPHTANAAGEFARLEAAGAVRRIGDAETLSAAVLDGLDGGAAAMGEAARAATGDPDLAGRIAARCLSL